MENSLYQSERILVNKWSYGLRLPFMKLWGYHRWADSPVQKEDILVFNNPANLSEPVIDRRESLHQPLHRYSRRYLADRFAFFSDSFRKECARPEVSLFLPQTTGTTVGFIAFHTFHRSQQTIGAGLNKEYTQFQRYEHYLLEQAMNGNCWIEPIVKEDSMEILKPLIIPSKGKAVRVYPWNKTLLRNTLVLHEKKQAEIKNDTLYVEGKPVQHCHFTKDYYWVGANNAINLSDSRLFGFVPKDHIIGKASIIWFSKEKGTGPFSGYRWGRIWKRVE